MNEFVALMHKYASAYGFVFVDSADDADVIFTNDVFPPHVQNLDIPLVKRMDGIFWQENLVQRNNAYIEAALMADMVIFITEYSKNSFKTLYNKEFHQLRDYAVSTHWTDPNGLPKIDISDVHVPDIFVAMATDWNRPEKRINELIRFAYNHDVIIKLIGTSDGIKLPPNIIPYGYLTSIDDITGVFNQSHAFLNLTCKDAATKTVCTAINYGLPVLYAGSGGVGELVKNCGSAIEENNDIEVLDYIPQLKLDEVNFGYMKFIREYSEHKKNITSLDTIGTMRSSLRSYFMHMIHKITHS